MAVDNENKFYLQNWSSDSLKQSLRLVEAFMIENGCPILLKNAFKWQDIWSYNNLLVSIISATVSKSLRELVDDRYFHVHMQSVTEGMHLVT